MLFIQEDVLKQEFEFKLASFIWSKQKWLLWRASFYPANQSNLKSIQRSLIGWKKAGPLKRPL